MTRRFGPTRAAGTVIEEQEGDKSISPGALGWAGYAGIMEKGPVGELMLVSSKTELLAMTGGILSDSLLPDCAQDFFSVANGAGGLALVRVTDGNELQSERTLYARIGSLLTPMGTLKAANGGRWGGKKDNRSYDLDAAGDLANTTLQLPAAIASSLVTDQLKGGWIELDAVANTRYPIIGNSNTGLITVAADQTMKDDWTAAAVPTNLRFYLILENEGKSVSFKIGDGEENPDTEFSIEFFVDGATVKKYGNLHTDPNNARYWVNVINNDTSNFVAEAVDLWTGAHVANVRPANYYGIIKTVTATVLTAEIHDFTINSPSGGNPTFALGTTTDEMIEQQITITMTAPTTGDVVSDKFGALGTVTLGTLFDPVNGAGGANINKWCPPFTVTTGATPLVATDTLVVNYKPFVADELIGGYLYPDKVNYKLDNYRIVDNDHKSITIASGNDMTTIAAIADEFMVSAAIEMAFGRDGNADVVDADYELQAWDVDTSPFNDVAGLNLGLIKFATPGVNSTAVQKAGVAYAEAKNHQYRYEAASTVLTENSALSLVNDTLGRSDYAVMAWPSYGYVPDPDPNFAREGRLKLIPMTGMIHGREASIARNWNGYHKAEAGVDATLPRVLKLPTLDRRLNEELLNPAGIAVIKKKQGNFVIWGDRTLHRDPSWKWKHQREQMCYYEQVLQESFDFIIFAINDAISDKLAETALITFFLPEFVKRALRGKTFQEAAIIKVDEELNTDVTRDAGDKIASVSLRLADTVERFIIKIGKQGIFESVA
jgi:hypothetical protein